MTLVLDSSITLAWIYGDETTAAIRQVFDEVIDNGAVVPVLWRLEVGNSLTVAVRRGRIEADFRQAALAEGGEQRGTRSTDRSACDQAASSRRSRTFT